MKHLTIDFSLVELARFGFPLPLTRRARALRLLTMTDKGFAFLCRVPRENLPAVRSWTREGSPAVRVEVLEKGKDGSETWLVRGRWHHPGATGRAAPNPEALRVLQAMVRRGVEPGSSLVLELSGDRLRVSMAAREPAVPRITAMLHGLGVEFRVSKVGRLTPGEGTALDSLTPQQLRVLQIAHEMGYYALPREATTEEIAKRLGMDKGTVGEHLRRAERRLMASLFSRR